jgi:CBS domain-containing protein
MMVADVMSKGVFTCRPSDSLNEAARLMWERDCGSLPVVNDDGQIVGMITDRDVCMAAYTRGLVLGAMSVASACSHGAFAVRETDTLGAAESLMRKHRVRRLPVVDAADRPVGILSINDLARAAHTTRHRADGLNPNVVLGTLAAIGEPQAQAIAAE